jgi:two-component system phosphate regulon sensor histidine kinase PhoR
MIRSRFLWKLYAGYVSLIFLTTFVTGVTISRWIERSTTRQIQQHLQGQAMMLRDLASPYADGPIDSTFELRVRALGVETAARLTVIRLDGSVIADSEEDPAAMDNHARRPEVMEALYKRVGVSVRYSRTLGENFMYVALPLEKNSETIGFVRVAVPLTAVRSQVSHARNVVVFGALGAAVLALLLGFVVANRITKPLREMADVADAIASGDYDQRVRVDRHDEIGSLAATLNWMNDRLRDQVETITDDRNKMAAILSGMVEGVIAIDKDERIAHINIAAERILSLSGEECVGMRIWEATRVREVSEALNAAMREERVTISEARLTRPQSEQVIRLVATPLRDANEKLTGALVVLHDVSELRQLEAVRRDFVANISHELKTPLAAIRGLVETVIDDKGMDQETHDRFLDKIQSQSTRLNSLVSDLLTISRLESEDVAADFRPLDFRAPVDESLRNLVPSADAKKLELNHTMPSSPVEIKGDREALRELVDNLVGNAIKYTPAGGRIDVRLRTEGDWAVLEVEDTGIGIAPGDQNRVFERFYRVDKARSRELGGTGLGLSIVRHVALSHGGGVSLRSAMGEGSIFRVQVPLGRIAAEPNAPH